jgi:hypothetical protein
MAEADLPALVDRLRRQALLEPDYSNLAAMLARHEVAVSGAGATFAR